MGLFFRKSVSFGPLRFTASKRGLSTSFGVKGARITAGPRGTFVTVSSHGVYYRHRVDSPIRVTAPLDVPKQVQQLAPPLDSVFQVPVAELVASNQNELIMRLNQNASAINPAWIPGVLTCLALFMVSSAPVGAWLLIVAGAAITILVSQRFTATHIQEIHYSLDPQATQNFAITQQAISFLQSCNRVWVLNTASATRDLKRNAGASTLITRNSAAVGSLKTRGFKSSLPVPSLQANSTIFHFLPDQILIYSQKRYASIRYDQISLNVNPSRYIETESIPSDSRQIDTTWRFVNRSGGPDRRFNNNRQIPVLQYGEVTMRVAAGLQVILQTSSFEKAQAFASTFQSLQRGM